MNGKSYRIIFNAVRGTQVAAKESATHFVRAGLFVVTGLLAACGGGDGTTQTSGTATLSSTQQGFENVALQSNGGLHYISGRLVYTTSSSGTPTLDTNSSTLVSEDIAVPQSPAVGPQTIQAVFSSLTPRLPVRASALTRVVNGGQVLVGSGTSMQLSYDGANIRETYLATDNATPLFTLQATSTANVDLTGSIAGSPSELFIGSALATLTNTINGASPYNKQATWQAGSAYIKLTRQYTEDVLFVGDCAAPATAGNAPTACPTTVSKLEAFFPHVSEITHSTYNLTDGQILNIAGVRAWIPNQPMQIWANPTSQYEAYYESAGAIYHAELIKGGTLFQRRFADGTAGAFTIYLNAAALQSVEAALTL